MEYDNFLNSKEFKMDDNTNIEYISHICKRCGRKLKNPASIEIGFGSVCFKKFMAESLLKPLFEVKQREVNEAEKTK